MFSFRNEAYGAEPRQNRRENPLSYFILVDNFCSIICIKFTLGMCPLCYRRNLVIKFHLRTMQTDQIIPMSLLRRKKNSYIFLQRRKFQLSTLNCLNAATVSHKTLTKTKKRKRKVTKGYQKY